MKNIKYITILLFMLSGVQLAFSQTEVLNNGRPLGTTPTATKQIENVPAINSNEKGGEIDDQDIPGQVQDDVTDYFYPTDLDLMMENSGSNIDSDKLMTMLNDMEAQINALRGAYEALRQENHIIRQSFSNCCSNSDLGLKATDAYLVQNAPNPFTTSAEINYFIPWGLENVQIHICDVKGEIIKDIDVKQEGYGSISIDAASFKSGSFIYTLSVGGEIVDSKVMIITK
jgi:hypothetical protein